MAMKAVVLRLPLSTVRLRGLVAVLSVLVLLAELTSSLLEVSWGRNLDWTTSLMLRHVMLRHPMLTSRFRDLVDFRPTPRSDPGGSSETGLEISVVREDIVLEGVLVGTVHESLVLRCLLDLPKDLRTFVLLEVRVVPWD